MVKKSSKKSVLPPPPPPPATPKRRGKATKVAAVSLTSAVSSDDVVYKQPRIVGLMAAAIARQKNVMSVEHGLTMSALVGIPFPAFGLEMFFNTSVLPLGRILLLAGIQETCKSGLLYELMRWFLDARGSGRIIDTEKKKTPDWEASIVGYDRLTHYMTVKAETIEEVQGTIYEFMAMLNMITSHHGKIAPMLIGLDSTTAAITQKEMEKGARERQVSLGFNQTANKTAKWLPDIATRIADHPALLCGVQHAKEVMVDGVGFSYKTYETKGANEWLFRAATQLLLTRVGKEWNTAKHTGRDICITPMKGEMPKSLRLPVSVEWYKMPLIDTRTGQRTSQQHTAWRWDLSTYRMLTDFDKCGIPQRWQTPIKDILGISESGGKINCLKLGLRGCKPFEIAPALYDPANADLLDQLRVGIGISKGHVFLGEAVNNYDDLREAQKALQLQFAGNNELKAIEYQKQPRNKKVTCEDDEQYEDAEYETSQQEDAV